MPTNHDETLQERYAREAAAMEQRLSAAPAAQPEFTDYNVWQCRIYVRKDVNLPRGFDTPPRSAACNALSAAGVPYAACFSGWGNAPIENELAVIENRLPAAQPCGECHLQKGERG